MKAPFGRRLTAELLGTGFLVATVIGSGIMGERLAGGNVAIALLANTIATGAALVALILAFGPISGAHFNPVVTLSDALEGGMPWKETPGYIAAQVLGAMGGAIVAHGMFASARRFAFTTCAKRSGANFQRIRGDIRIDVRDLGMRETTAGRWWRSRWARTSQRRTGSRRRHRSRIRR